MQRIPGTGVAFLALVGMLGSAVDAAVAQRSSNCPLGLLPLEANSVGPAAAAAFRHESPRSKPQVMSATFATWDTGRGREAKFECGTRVWRRTVVVYITLRAFLPSASLSERVDFVGRFSDGYKVWQIVH